MTEARPGASNSGASPAAVASAVSSALFLGYSAPMPGADSRYADSSSTAHETRLLGVPDLAQSLSAADQNTVGETVLGAVLGSVSATGGYADLRAAGYLAPLSRASLLGENLEKTLAKLSHADARHFARALEAAGPGVSVPRARPRTRGPSRSRPGTQGLAGAIEITLGAGRDATLRDAMRLASAGGDPMAREYANGFEITLGLARPALVEAMARIEATRPALVQVYLEVLAEVPDPDVARRAGLREAEEVSRMANGALKAGGANSRRGLQAITNLDGLLRSDQRLKPSATETSVVAAAFLLGLQYGPRYLNARVRPAPHR